jgi:site-specific DNA recombinase
LLYPDMNLQKRTQQSTTRYRTALYLRLSREDGDKTESDSIANQRTLLEAYAADHPELCIVDEFVDDGYSGSNFDRPEFERLLKALQERKIDCIVVKDFSRLGRNFVETGQYLEQVFPLFGVRFIAINDNYDSLNSQSRDGMLVPIKSMINEMYSKDLSQKIQSCFRSKEVRGEIYTPVPFGYKKNQKNHLVLDEEVSDVVVRIFLWKKSGMKEREIAKKLSAQGIPTPFTRRCQLGYLKNTLRIKDPAWQTVFVTKVLENPIYTGTMVYNRIAYDETYRKIGENPRESWRMVPDSHPAIISWELFDEVSALREAEQAVKEERKKWCRQRRENNPNIFKGRIFCKECGEKLFCHWQSDGTLYFYCASCHVSISEKDLWNGINKELHQRMEEHRDLQKLVRKSSGKSKLQSKEIATKREIEQASGNIVRLESQKRSGYEQYVLGKISKEKFLELKQDAENEIEAFRQTKAENEKELVVVQEELQQKKQIAGNTEVLLTADNLQQYVKKIEVDYKKNTYTEFVF